MHPLDELARRVPEKLRQFLSLALLGDERMFPYELAFIVQRAQFCEAKLYADGFLGVLLYEVGVCLFFVQKVFNLSKTAPQVDAIREDAVCCSDDWVIEVFPVDVRILLKF